MSSLLVDEDLPRSTAVQLREAGYEAVDVREVGLRGHSDADIFAYAQSNGLVLVTADLGFASVLSFPLGTHSGMIVLRLPNELSTLAVNRQILRALAELRREDLTGMLVIVEAGRTRVRRPPAAGS